MVDGVVVEGDVDGDCCSRFVAGGVGIIGAFVLVARFDGKILRSDGPTSITTTATIAIRRSGSPLFGANFFQVWCFVLHDLKLI